MSKHCFDTFGEPMLYDCNAGSATRGQLFAESSDIAECPPPQQGTRFGKVQIDVEYEELADFGVDGGGGGGSGSGDSGTLVIVVVAIVAVLLLCAFVALAVYLLRRKRNAAAIVRGGTRSSQRTPSRSRSGSHSLHTSRSRANSAAAFRAAPGGSGGSGFGR